MVQFCKVGEAPSENSEKSCAELRLPPEMSRPFPYPGYRQERLVCKAEFSSRISAGVHGEGDVRGGPRPRVLAGDAAGHAASVTIVPLW